MHSWPTPADPSRPGRDQPTRRRIGAWIFSFPALAGLVSAVVFLPLLHNLGFYWDDWPSLWFLHAFGAPSFIRGFMQDRPLLAGAFLLTTPILGESALAWQLAGVALRALAGLALWAALRGAWPQHQLESAAAALLFIVYPGFGQQYIAITYTNAFLIYTIYLGSFAASVWAIRQAPSLRRWLLWLAAWLGAAVGLLTTEYFLGLELLRPALLLAAAAIPWRKPLLARENVRSAARALAGWLPIVLIWLGVIGARLAAPSPRAAVVLFEQFKTAPLAALAGLAATIAGDLVELLGLGWVYGLDLPMLAEFEPRIWVMFAAAILLAGGLAGAWFARQTRRLPGVAGRGALLWLGMSIYAFLVSGWPVWVSDLHIELVFPWDRLLLMMLPALGMLAAGVASLLWRWRGTAALLLAVLVGLSSGAQFCQRLLYRQEWLAQQAFMWQLTWRIPQLEPGTLLLTSAMPFRYYTDNSLSAPLNWAYMPQPGPHMQALLYNVEARPKRNFSQTQSIDQNYRVTRFTGSSAQAITLFYDPPRCLVVVDPAIDRYLPVKPLYIKQLTPLSNLERIVVDPAQTGQPAARPPAPYYGAEPLPSWCTYYEKAALYNQAGLWQQAAEMADKALHKPRTLSLKTVSELNPFIEAYGRSGQWDKARQVTQDSYTIWDKTSYSLCDVWRRMLQETPASAPKAQARQQVDGLLSCKPSLP